MLIRRPFLMMMTSWSLCMMNRSKTELIRSLFLSEIAYPMPPDKWILTHHTQAMAAGAKTLQGQR